MELLRTVIIILPEFYDLENGNLMEMLLVRMGGTSVEPPPTQVALGECDHCITLGGTVRCFP